MGKPTLFLLIAVILLTSLLLVFGSGRRNPNDIVIWTQDSTPGRAVLDRLLDQFMLRNPAYRVSFIFYETEELRSNYIISALGGSGPELVYGPADQVGPFEVMGIIQPLEELLEPEYLDQFVDDAKVWWNGHLYMLGDRIGNHLTLVYNKALVPEPPKNTDEMIEIGKRLTRDFDGDGLIDQYGLVWNFVEPFFFVPFLGGFGGWVMDEEGNPTLNTQATVEACKFIVELRNVHKIIPREADYNIANEMFKQGRAGMIINGPWSWGGYIEAGIDIGLARIPKVSATGLWPTPMKSATGYSININVEGQHLQNTLEVLKYLNQRDVQLDFTKSLMSIPSRKDAQTDPLVTENELLRASKDQLSVARPMPIHPAMRAIWDAMRGPYQRVLNGTMTPEEAAAAMQREAEKKIAEMFDNL
jgi:maltose-binding protein MalE